MEKDTGNGSFNIDMIILASYVGQKLDTELDLKMSLALQQAQKWTQEEDHGENFLTLNILLISKSIVEVNDYFDC